MDFEYSKKTQDLIARVSAFMNEHVYPQEARFHAEVAEGDRWQPTKVVEELKVKARELKKLKESAAERLANAEVAA